MNSDAPFMAYINYYMCLNQGAILKVIILIVRTCTLRIP